MFFARSPSITPERAAARLTRGELVLVDVRQPAELRAGRVRDAVNIPLAQLPGRLDELDSGRPVAFLCHSGCAALVRLGSPSRRAMTPSTSAAG